MSKKRIFIVEDEAIIAADLAHRIEQLGFEVAGTADTGQRAIELIPQSAVDAVLMDIVLKGPMDGIEATLELCKRCDVPVIYVTSHTDNRTMQAAVGTDPYGYVLKPFHDRELEVAIRIALHRHGTESKLRRLERWMATLLASIGDGVIAADTEGRVTLLNAAAQRMTGWSDDEALGKRFDEVFHLIDTHRERAIESLPTADAETQAELEFEAPVLLQRRSGEPLPIDDSVAPIRDDAGRSVGVVLVFRDASQRLSNEQLRREKLTAELASQQKSHFLSRVSHELRTPLNAIIGFTQLLQQDSASPLNAVQRKRLGLVNTASQHLLSLINDVLDLSRIEQGSRPLQLMPVSLHRVIGEVVELLCSEALNYEVQILVPSMPAGLHVQADERALGQVLLNLLSNGVKYNRRGGTLLLEVIADAHQVEISVRDQGLGLTPSELSQLFQPFNRLNAENSRVSGSGLGLVIAKALTDSMGGTLSAASEPNLGTRFALTLPLAATAPSTIVAEPRPARPQAANDAHPTATLLYIEDDPINALLLSEALKRVPQWRVILADNGETGLELARQALPDLIITDINLPGMSGHEVIRALRADANTAALRCVALSADALPDQIKAGTESGFDGYWTKPIDLGFMFECLAKWLPDRKA